MAHARSFRRTGRTVTEEEAFLAQDVAEETTTTQLPADADGLTTGTRVEHRTNGRVLMWKPGPDGNFTPRTVAENSRADLVRNGWKFRCPDCNTNHEQSQYPPEDPNSCPARAPLDWTSCPVCGKRQFDNMRWKTAEADPNASDAAAMIVDDTLNATTPAQRVLLVRNLHMWTRHPRQSQMMGIAQLPSALREIVDGARTPL